VAKEYIIEKVVGQTSIDDCLHIALATISRADFYLAGILSISLILREFRGIMRSI